jgi:cellulose synthase/poly-beta-1,6-N-acetylglucosamine synthase-like glycosyltransferase
VSLVDAVAVFAAIVTTYFVLWNAWQILMGIAGARYAWRYQRRRTLRARALVARLASPPLVSVVVPARNEALTIVESVRALLALEYEAREIIVVNDGSSDDTLALLERTFHLVPAPLAFEQPLKTAAVRGVYRSVDEPDLVVLDKVSAGRKADASNAGINAASGTLVLVIDADTMLEPDALSRGALPFLESPDTVAVGGYVAIANGSRVESARVIDAGMPRGWFARFQIVEYMRSFLLFRLACASINAVTIVSGAFGLFRRDAVIEVGGFDPHAIGEDLDLTLRLQRHFRRLGRPARISFVPLPVCWTQAPEDLASLRAQRRRWRRGLLQALWKFRGMIGNPRYGTVGLLVLPSTTLFEGLGPLIEVIGLVVTTIAAAIGILDGRHYWILVAASVLLGAATTLFGVLLSDLTARRYLRGRDLAVLCLTAVLESVGYRQLNAWWGCIGTFEALTGKGGWGPMKRRAF